MMYVLHKSVILNVGWGQRAFYNTISYFIDPETKAKIQLTGDGTCDALKELFHPSQLEKRFGGAMETPTQYWPPYVGKIF